MQPKLADLKLLEQDSIYIPISGMKKGENNGPEQLVYAAYCANMYRQFGVNIQPFEHIPLSENNRPVYFHGSNYIPHFLNNGYKVDVITGFHLVEYLKAVPSDCYVMISVKDEGSQQMTEEMTSQLLELGISAIDKSKLRHSFIWIARKKDEFSFDVVYEDCSTEQLFWEGTLGDSSVTLISGGALSTNLSSIQIDGVERSENQRGFNIVTCSADQSVKSVSFDTFATLYVRGSLFRAQSSKPMKNRFMTISRAGGRIDGVNYTNCKEAFEQSYWSKGHTVFEADIATTSDGELVLRQDWDTYLYGHLQQVNPDESATGEPLTLQQFSNLKICNKYSPMTIADLFQFLVNHPDAYVVTDTKFFDPERVDQQFKKIVEAAALFGSHLLLRITPQLYTEQMYDMVEKHFSFPRYIYTLYQTSATDEEVVRFVRNKSIKNVAMSPARYNPKLGMQLRELGASVYIHTINDVETVREYVQLDVDGFYTDDLSWSEIDREFLTYKVELETRRKVLSEFLIFYFGIPEQEAQTVVHSIGHNKIITIGQKLFQCETIAEVHSLLKT